MLWRRNLALTAAALLLGGCTQLGGDAASVAALARSLWSQGKSVTLKEAAGVPYASIGVRLGDSNEILLVLATNDSGQQLWTSAEKIALVTQNGRIVRTAGLPYNLAASQIRQTQSATAFTWQIDLPDQGLYALPITCTTTPPVDETIVILGASIQTRRTQEHCSSASTQLRWSFTNTYWRDPNAATTWKSIQHINPKSKTITLQTLRPL